ncbi:MAG: CinA family nicotinamide mononucleotide deamidase-related protein [Kiritimatiellaeota bacterium]|nr:CinA family nicotinamide mononucleotide deamidase-related protein [Kiritimatiellota bacterium]
MATMLSVELVTTGSELLSGRTVNTHAQTLADKLHPFGLKLLRDTTVTDDLAAITDSVRGALERVDIVFVSGGLGGTSDDITRDALAQIVGGKLVQYPEALAALEKRYAAMGRPVTDVARRQTLILECGEGLLNPVGIAPGMAIPLGAKMIFVLPGPPREFLGVLETGVFPRLGKMGLPVFQALENLLECTGLGETEIAERLEQIGLPTPEIEVGYCAAMGQIEVRLAAAPANAAFLEEKTAAVRAALGAAIYAEMRIGLEEAVGRLLAAQKKTMAVAESCTGGLIGHRLTTIAGSSVYFLGGVICYSNDSKVRDLAVPRELIEKHGAVSEEVARAMAEGVRARFGADFGIAVTGIAGPDGGTPAKPVGTVWLAVADASGTVAKHRCFPTTRENVKLWSSQQALDLLRRRLQGV